MNHVRQTPTTRLRIPFPKVVQASYIEEAPLIFANNSIDVDPKRGLSLHGPADTKLGDPETIRIGVVSSASGIDDVTNWIIRSNQHPTQSLGEQPFIAMTFPGFVKAFHCRFLASSDYNESISSREISDILRVENPNLRIKRAAQKYASKVRLISRKIPRPDVIICHEPKEVEQRCGAGMSWYDKQGGELPDEAKREAERIRRNIEGMQLFAPLDEDVEDLLDSAINQDFRAYLKARCLDFGIPIQILTQTVLERLTQSSFQDSNERRSKRQDPSIIAWNLFIAIYYKARHLPWKVGGLKSGTCYVGVTFYYDKTSRSKIMHASLAQIFSDTGQGMVVRSDSFKWDVKENGTPHLARDTASKLLSDAIGVYAEHHNGQFPNRVVIYKKSLFNRDEQDGFSEALANVPKHDLLSLSADGRDIFFYRNGDHPIVRGAFLKLDERSQLLYSNGYVPYLHSYPHPRVPRPLEITSHFGDSTTDELTKEMMALTRLNWNSSDYCSYWPVTLMFSKKVGDILGRVRPGETIQQDYYHYT